MTIPRKVGVYRCTYIIKHIVIKMSLVWFIANDGENYAIYNIAEAFTFLKLVMIFILLSWYISVINVSTCIWGYFWCATVITLKTHWYNNWSYKGTSSTLETKNFYKYKQWKRWRRFNKTTQQLQFPDLPFS